MLEVCMDELEVSVCLVSANNVSAISYRIREIRYNTLWSRQYKSVSRSETNPVD